MTAEGQTHTFDQTVDVSELMGDITGTVQWGDGTSSPATIASKPAAGPLKVRIDYRFDATNFFQSSERKALLQTALDSVVSRFSDSLSAILPGGVDTWQARFKHPSTGNDASLPNLSIPANELLVFVGARAIGVEAALGNRGGFSASGQQSFVDTVKARGQAGGLTNPQTDVGPWGGAIAFDTGRNWYFGTSLAGIASNQIDFVTVAAHEFLHVLGFGTTQSFDTKIVNSKFTGAMATQEFGAPVPMADADHFANDITYRGVRPSMIPTINNAVRLLPTRLDYAAMNDIGWQLISPSARITGNKVFGDNANYAALVSLQGSIGAKSFPFSIPITNVIPTFVARGNQSATTGVPVTINRIGQFSDPGFGTPSTTPPKSETFTYRIQWGDGLSDNGNATVESVGNGMNPTRGFFDGTHTYTAPGTYTVTLTVTDDDGGSAQQQFQITVAAPPILSLTIDKANFSEAAGAGAAVLTISRPAAFSASAITVQLVSSDTSEVTLPASTTLAAGVTSTTVGVTAVDDSLFDGNQTVELSASGTNFQTAILNVTVTDFQPISLAAQSTQLHEDEPTQRSTTLTIGIRSPAPSGGATVALSATPAGVINFPASISIPAGLAQVDVTVSAIDDLRPQRLRSVTLQAAGSNLVSKSLTLTVNDSDPFRWTNPDPTRQMDVDDNRSVDPLDVLVIINEINRAGSRLLNLDTDLTPPYYDTNPDGTLDPLDVLVLINFINANLR